MVPEIPRLSELVRACLRSGEATDWNKLVQCLQPTLSRVIYRVASRRGVVRLEEIDDILQDVFMKIGGGKPLADLSLDDELSTWAFFKTIAINCARDHFRGKYADKRGFERTIPADARLEELAIDGITGVERQILFRQVKAALEATPREQLIFWLYYQEGLTAREIAAIPELRLSAKGVESVIHRLTAAVRKSLKEKQDRSREGNRTRNSS